MSITVLVGPAATELYVRFSEERLFGMIVSSYPSHAHPSYYIERIDTMSDVSKSVRLANIYCQQADVARQQGDIKRAVEHFGKAIDLYKELAQTRHEPEFYELCFDTIEKVAATYHAAGELAKAEETYAEVALLRERTLGRDREGGRQQAAGREGDE